MSTERTKQIQCRTHGGQFTIPVKPGRQPVRCGGKFENCTKLVADQQDTKQIARTAKKRNTLAKTDTRVKAEDSGSLYDGTAAGKPRLSKQKKDLRTRAVKPAEVTTRVNKSVPQAHAARERLEKLGWTVKGKARFEGSTGIAEVIATRGEETLVMTWSDGELVGQDYSAWPIQDEPSDKTSGMPRAELDFDINEISDKELFSVLMGRPVEWWNGLAKSKEKAVISPKRMTIEWTRDTDDPRDPIPADRMIKFAAYDGGGGGFRAFRLSQLLKVS